MANPDKKTVTPEASASSSASTSSSALTMARNMPSLASLQSSPLPGNRPIADNVTDDIDDLLGYLD